MGYIRLLYLLTYLPTYHQDGIIDIKLQYRLLDGTCTVTLFLACSLDSTVATVFCLWPFWSWPFWPGPTPVRQIKAAWVSFGCTII